MAARGRQIMLVSLVLWALGDMGPFIAIFAREELAANIFDVGWVLAVFYIVQGIFFISLGRFSSGPRRQKQILIVGHWCYAVLTICFVWVDSVLSLIILQVCLGVAEVMTMPTWNALFARYTDFENDGKMWARAGVCRSFASAGSAIMLGALITYFSYTTVFITLGCIQVLGAAYQMRILTISDDRYAR